MKGISTKEDPDTEDMTIESSEASAEVPFFDLKPSTLNHIIAIITVGVEEKRSPKQTRMSMPNATKSRKWSAA